MTTSNTTLSDTTTSDTTISSTPASSTAVGSFAAAGLLDNEPVRDLLSQCIHCGLCLPACPTYQVFHTEMDSPRGRIALVQAAADGRIEIEGTFQSHLELCLGCRACETACPSGVQYGAIYEVAREAIEETRTVSRRERLLRRLALRELMPHRGRLRAMARLMKVYQALHLSPLVQRLSFLPGKLRFMEQLMPRLPMGFPDYSRPAPALGRKRGEVACLVGCVQDAFLSGVNAATVRVLQRNGYEVHFPQTQTCCGAAQLHVGEGDLARDLARRNIDACADRDYVAIISNAGGCGATLKQYAHLLEHDADYAPKAAAFVARLQDISEFLADNLHVPPTASLPLTVTYVDSCHLRHGQKVVQQPRRLLAAIPDLNVVELRQPDMCCGSAGVYNIVQTETAEQVLDAKMADVTGTGAQVVVTTNTGCHMQMIYGVKKAGMDAEVVHLVELLDRAYRAGENPPRAGERINV
ncbi:MAG: heterodisulfide reductase-related iron-sulfur binding cluster [Litorilinea sp.]